VKPENKALPEKSILENCFDSNSDGAGFMYIKNRTVHISKGYMKFKPLYESLLDIDPALPLVVHFRIATAGGISQHNCHPFPLSDNVHDLKSLDIEADIGIAHNGIISIKEEAKLSDTQTFIKNVLFPLKDKINFRPFQDMIYMAANSSKFAIMQGNGSILLLGDFINDDGIYYSNSSYKMPSFKTYYGNLWNFDKDYPAADYFNTVCPFCHSDNIASSINTYDLVCKDCGETWAEGSSIYRDI
jgi:predicted glutamine amidotransferase